MLSTPLISCSIGVATVFETTSAEAPANVAVTSTVGGAISGYSLIGSARNDMAPTSVRMIAMPAANIGRSIKKCESRMAIYPVAALGEAGDGLLCCSRFDGAVLGFDFLPRPGPRQPVDDDAIGRRTSGADDTPAVYDRTELDALGADRAVVGDRENDLARLIGR